MEINGTQSIGATVNQLMEINGTRCNSQSIDGDKQYINGTWCNSQSIDGDKRYMV